MSVNVSKIKTSMRITNNCLDADIQDNVDACLLDMGRVGVDTINTTALHQKACELYCKWQYDYLGKGEQYKTNYNSLRDGMTLSEDYKEETDAQ